MTVHHDPAHQEFSIEPTASGQEPAELAYAHPGPNLIDFTHTFVPPERRGQGEAEALARAGLAYARQQGWRVRTTCPFMAGYVARHQPEYADLLE